MEAAASSDGAGGEAGRFQRAISSRLANSKNDPGFCTTSALRQGAACMARSATRRFCGIDVWVGSAAEILPAW